MNKISYIIFNLINKILSSFGVKITTKYELSLCKNTKNALTELYVQNLLKTTQNNSTPIECIIFSFDRTLQLHALLSSINDKVTPSFPINILYHSSTPDHQNAYEELIKIFSGKSNIKFTKQTGDGTFNNDLVVLLESIKTKRIFFLVDDIIITENVNLEDFMNINLFQFVPSLRMGLNLNKVYTVQKNQSKPPFLPNVINNEKLICWAWSQGEHDWNYPISVDGHLFDYWEIKTMINLIEFTGPNTLEHNLRIFSSIFNKRYGVSYSKSCIVNNPCNKVQNESNNLHSNSHHQDYLLKQWQNGLQINYKELYGFVNESVHQNIYFTFKKRN